MKKVLLSAVAMLFAGALMAQTIVSTQVEKRNVVIEEYTGVGCGYCPDGHARANAICNQYDGHAWAINIHEGGYAAGSGYETTYGDGLAAQYSISGYPCGTVNRGTMSGRGDWASQAATVRGQDSPINVAATASIDPNTRELIVNVELYVTGTQTVSSNFLNVALVQNNIIGPQSNYGNYNSDYILPDGNYRHMHMFRDLLTGQWGEEITGLSVGTFMERTYTYQIPQAIGAVPISDFSDLEIIVFVSETHKNILTGAKADLTILPAVYMAGFSYENSGDCSLEYTPVLTVSNTTNEEASSFYFTYDNEQIYSSKTIAAGQTDTFHFPIYTIQYDNTPVQHYEPTLSVTLDSYEDASNNTITLGYDASVDINPINIYTCEGPFRLDLGIDRYGEETTVDLYNTNGCTKVWDCGPFTRGTSNTANARHYYYSLSPADAGLYVLRLMDSYGDGMSYASTSNPAGLTLTNAGGEIFHQDGNFTDKVVFYLNITNAGDGTYVGVDDVANISFEVYPNPVSNRLYINCDEAISHIDVIDMAGRTVISNNGNQHSINTEALGTGVYMLRIVSENGISTSKFVKE